MVRGTSRSSGRETPCSGQGQGSKAQLSEEGTATQQARRELEEKSKIEGRLFSHVDLHFVSSNLPHRQYGLIIHVENQKCSAGVPRHPHSPPSPPRKRKPPHTCPFSRTPLQLSTFLQCRSLSWWVIPITMETYSKATSPLELYLTG